MQLTNVLHKVNYASLHGDAQTEIKDLAFDSRKVSAGTLFVAQRGVQVDGHNYIAKAIEQGAVAVVCEELPKQLTDGVVFVQVEDSSKTLGVLAANYYGNPSEELQLVGVTGTNGKTTIATLLYTLFTKLGYASGLLSTVKVMVGTELFPATHTTPDVLSINHYLRKMVDGGVSHCFMEVSSHGIDQDRISGLHFKGGVFTNLSHDHLDYHNTFKEYRDVKKRFFDELPKSAFALTNADDKNGMVMLQNTKATKKTYAQKTLADYKVRVIEKSFSGMLLSMNEVEAWTRLIGGFNAYNFAAIYGVATELGLENMELLQTMSDLEGADGRFEYQTSSTGIVSVVDYAHTPDALKNVLATLNDIVIGDAKIITVVGCGGDRDQEKRPKMAQIAVAMSDQVVFTADNPRSEDPYAILEQMENGVSEEAQEKYITIADRKQAIKTACKLANPKDVVLVAGKGHETYQEINGERTYFNDVEVLEEVLKTLKK